MIEYSRPGGVNLAGVADEELHVRQHLAEMVGGGQDTADAVDVVTTRQPDGTLRITGYLDAPAPHPNLTDPVADPAYPLITAADTDEDATPPPEWDTHPELAPTARVAGPGAVEPDEAWRQLMDHDRAAGS